mgnify:CR=1 FL=1
MQQAINLYILTKSMNYMELRDKLLPNATPERIANVLSKIKVIEDQIDKGENVDKLIEEFNQYTGRLHDKYTFQHYWRSIDIEHFARNAAQPVPTKLDDITKEELIEIVDRICEADDNTDFYLEVFEVNVPHPHVSDLIYWPSNEGLPDDLSSEQIVEIALNYKPKPPIIL